ncbi:MAG TPA: hypothetical protein VH120_17455 [Gemmataceae bacterium]|nr:hypothetical protein [Gemmataceae bacterium]
MNQNRPAVTDPAEVVAIEESTLYDDMQHVRRYPRTMDRTQGRKDARKWKDRNLSAFLARYADLEKAHAGTKSPAPAQPATYDGDGPCPTCHRQPNIAPEELGPEWLTIEQILKHKPEWQTFLEHKDEFRRWLGEREAAAATGG